MEYSQDAANDHTTDYVTAYHVTAYHVAADNKSVDYWFGTEASEGFSSECNSSTTDDDYVYDAVTDHDDNFAGFGVWPWSDDHGNDTDDIGTTGNSAGNGTNGFRTGSGSEHLARKKGESSQRRRGPTRPLLFSHLSEL